MTTLATDPLTLAFGAFGPAPSAAADWSTGSLREVPALDAMWAGLELAGILSDVDRYPGTQGTRGLLDGLAELVEHGWRTAVPAERIVAVHGAFDGLAHALAGLPAGSPVLVPAPGFDVRVPVQRAGGVAVPVGWELGSPVAHLVTQLAAAAVRTGAAAMVVSLPRNPDGATATPDDWDALADLAGRTGMRLVIDDVYAFTDDRRPAHLLGHDRVVVVDSLSKRLGAPGLRAGFVVAPPELLPVVRASAAGTVGLARPVAHIAQRAVRHWLDAGIDATVRTELGRRAMVLRARLLPEVPLILRPGSLYAVVRVGDDRLAAGVLEAAGLRVTPGRSMAMGAPPGPPFLRLCIGAGRRVDDVARTIGRAWPMIARSPRVTGRGRGGGAGPVAAAPSPRGSR